MACLLSLKFDNWPCRYDGHNGSQAADYAKDRYFNWPFSSSCAHVQGHCRGIKLQESAFESGLRSFFRGGEVSSASTSGRCCKFHNHPRRKKVLHLLTKFMMTALCVDYMSFWPKKPPCETAGVMFPSAASSRGRNRSASGSLGKPSR